MGMLCNAMFESPSRALKDRLPVRETFSSSIGQETEFLEWGYKSFLYSLGVSSGFPQFLK
jgi:hypothetical protein